MSGQLAGAIGTFRDDGAERAAAARAMTYLTLEGEVIDLSGLSNEERVYFARCYAAYRAGSAEWADFVRLVGGPENPVVCAAGGRVTRAVWDHPLFRAVRDLEDRYGIAHGELAPTPGYDLEHDPIADSWVPSVEAAQRKGVTLAGLHHAARRGAIIVRPARPGGTRLVVSANSLERWHPGAAHQAAGRARHAPAAALAPPND